MQQKTIKLFKRIAKQALQLIPNLSVSDLVDSYRMLSAQPLMAVETAAAACIADYYAGLKRKRGFF